MDTFNQMSVYEMTLNLLGFFFNYVSVSVFIISRNHFGQKSGKKKLRANNHAG